jgi:alpha-1,4-digalacturonate transport system permease protein
MIGFALVTALALNRRIRARGFFRGIFFFPVMLSPVVVAMTWVWLLQRDGALNGMLGAFGFERVSWLTDPGRAFGWSIFVTVWAHMGFYTVILLAGLQSIPRRHLRSRQDGSRLAVARVHPHHPAAAQARAVVVFVLATIRSVQTFDEISCSLGAGPARRPR